MHMHVNENSRLPFRMFSMANPQDFPVIVRIKNHVWFSYDWELEDHRSSLNGKWKDRFWIISNVSRLKIRMFSNRARFTEYSLNAFTETVTELSLNFTELHWISLNYTELHWIILNVYSVKCSVKSSVKVKYNGATKNNSILHTELIWLARLPSRTDLFLKTHFSTQKKAS